MWPCNFTLKYLIAQLLDFCVIYLFISDTLVKLMEYGDEDDDLDDSSEESLASTTCAVGVQKPFWAL